MALEHKKTLTLHCLIPWFFDRVEKEAKKLLQSTFQLEDFLSHFKVALLII